MNALMIDFETLSLKDNAVLLALGACTFDPVTGDIEDTFYAPIDPRTQPGRDISASTVLWWMEQSGEARNALVASTKAADTLESNPPEEGPELDELYATAAHSIHNVSRAFIAWYEQQGDIEGVWSNGAVDHGWLSSMFEYSGLKNPVPYRLQRDFRTLKALNPTVKHTFSGVAHNALDDAINQAAHMSAMWVKE